MYRWNIRTYNYDFELTTIMVIDEFGQGFPVAFMFSNKKDTHIYEEFLKAFGKKWEILQQELLCQILPKLFIFPGFES
jgi:hypothetical protein